MIIRYLTQNDVTEHDKITSQAFSYSCEIGDPESVLPCEKVLGAFDDDDRTLFADLEIHEKTCYYDGGFLTCAAVGGVAAKPEHRGKGAVKALFDRLFRDAAYDVSFLYPFSEPYYRKLGYERTGYSVCARVPFTELSQIPRNQDAVLYEGKNTEQLLALYNRCAGKYNLNFVRTNADAFSQEPYYSQKYTYIRGGDAYATVRIDREKSTLFVDEICFDSRDAMLGILGFLRNFESNQKNVCFLKLPDHSPVLDCLQDLKNCEITLHNTGSVRILRAENVLKAHRYPSGSGAFTLRIGDDGFKVAFSDNGIDVEKTDVRDPDVVLTASSASRLLLCGCLDAAYLPDVIVKNAAIDLRKLFPPKTSFFSDAF